jgi:hypothetical protein
MKTFFQGLVFYLSKEQAKGKLFLKTSKYMMNEFKKEILKRIISGLNYCTCWQLWQDSGSLFLNSVTF